MRNRLVPLAFALVAYVAFATTGGAAPAKPWLPPKSAAPKAPAKAPKLRPAVTPTGKPITAYIDGVPDTGQFLPDTAWVVRVGDRVTTVANYLDRWFGGDPNYRPTGDSLGRVQFMNQLIDRDVLGLSALALKRPLDFTDRTDLRLFEQRVLSDLLLQYYVYDSVKVRDSEVDSIARQIGMEGHFRHILVAHKDEADRIRAALVKGKLAWHDAVTKHTVARDDKGPDGDRGWVGWTSLPFAMASNVFDLQPGGISPVIRTNSGYEIVQLIEKRASTQYAFSTFHNMVQRQLFEDRASVYAEKIQGMLRQHLGMVHDSANIDFASSHFQPSTSPGQQSGRLNITVNSDMPLFSPEDTARVLTRWNGGQWTLGAFIAWYSTIPAIVRPNVNYPDAMKAQIEGYLLEPYRADVARERHLDTLAIYRKRMNDKLESIAVEHMYRDSVASKVWVSREERQKYYQEHLGQFATQPEVEYAAFYRLSRASIDSAASVLREPNGPQALLKQDSLLHRVTGSIRQRTADDRGPYHVLLFEEMRPGEVQTVGPDTAGAYVAIKLLSYTPARQMSFDDAQRQIDDILTGTKSEERMQAMLANLRRRYTIASRPELVMRIKLARAR